MKFIRWVKFLICNWLTLLFYKQFLFYIFVYFQTNMNLMFGATDKDKTTGSKKKKKKNLG